jgi:hypothetical protein
METSVLPQVVEKFFLVSSIFFTEKSGYFIEIKHAKWLGQYLHNGNVYTTLLTHTL